MEYNFDQNINRRNSDSIKWNKYDQDVLPLWVADMDYRSPESVIQALKERVEHGVFGYPCEAGELKTVIVDRMQSLYNWSIKEEDIIFTPGVVPSFNLACRALTAPGDSVAIQTPVYPPFFSAPDNANLVRLENELILDEEDRYRIDFEGFRNTLRPSTSLFILCNPHNPVGRVFSKEELTKLADICLQNNTIICSDEIHCDLVFSGHKHIPIASINEDVAQNSITLMAPSKTYNIAGLGCSFIIAQNSQLRKQLMTTMQGITGHVNIFGYTAALAAYNGGSEWLKSVLDYLENNRNFVYNYVNNELPGISMVQPEATYLAWLDCRGLQDMDDPSSFFFNKEKIALNDGRTFGKCGTGFVRLNFGCTRTVLENALERMRSVL